MWAVETPPGAGPAFDGAVFRRVIGSFMTGVVVITTSTTEPRAA